MKQSGYFYGAIPTTSYPAMMFIAWANDRRCVEKVNIEKYILKQFLFSWWCWIYNSFRQSVHSDLLPPEFMTPQVSMKGFTGGPPSLYICSPWALRFYIHTVDIHLDGNVSAVRWDKGTAIHMSYFFYLATNL